MLRIGGVVALGAVDVVLGAALLVADGTLDRPDRAVLDALDPHLEWTWRQITGDVVVELLQPVVTGGLLVLLAVLATRRTGRRAALVHALGMVAAVTVPLFVLKTVIDRPPVSGHGSSFPSGHEASLIAYLGTLARSRTTRAGRLAAARLVAVLAAAMAVALVVTGTHWLSDVIGGAALGSAALLAVPAPPVPLLPERLRRPRRRRAGGAGPDEGAPSPRRRTRSSTAERPS